MNDFAEVLATNPSRLVVTFRRGPDGSEQFQWGVVGNIPILSLIGHILEVQRELIQYEYIPECDAEGQPPALVIVWDVSEQTFKDYKHPAIPNVSLVGMLEVIKGLLVTSRMAQHMAAQQTRIVGPDGRPMR